MSGNCHYFFAFRVQGVTTGVGILERFDSLQLGGVFIGDCPEAAFFTDWAIIWLRGLAPPFSVAAFAPGLSKLPNGWRTHLTHCRNSCPTALSWGSFHASGSWLVNSTSRLAAKSAALFNRPSSTSSCLYLSFNHTKAGKSDTAVLVNSLMTTFDVLLTLQASFITTSQLFPQTPTRLFHHPFASFFFNKLQALAICHNTWACGRNTLTVFRLRGTTSLRVFMPSSLTALIWSALASLNNLFPTLFKTTHLIWIPNRPLFNYFWFLRNSLMNWYVLLFKRLNEKAHPLFVNKTTLTPLL